MLTVLRIEDFELRIRSSPKALHVIDIRSGWAF